MTIVRLRPEAEVRAAAQRAFEEHRSTILEAVPDSAVEHVGATAVPGAVTKGDLDLLVRVSAERFEGASDCLRRLCAVHQPHNWTPTLASYVDPESSDPPVGVQLVVAGSSDDAMFRRFRDALTADAGLAAEYDALKRRHDGQEYERYTEAKGEFIEQTLARLTP